MLTIAGAVAVAAALWLWRQLGAKPTVKQRTVNNTDRHREKERRKEAHYMRNFWNYDGSEQEEFEE